MIHVAFLFHLFALFVGGAAIVITLLRYFHNRNILILNFASVLFGTELIMMGLAINLYGSITKINIFFLSRFLDSIGVILLSIFMPILIASLFTFPKLRITKWIHVFICIIITGILVSYYRLSLPEVIARIGQTLFFLTIILPLIWAFIRKNKFIGNKHFKRSLHLLFLSMIIVLPLVILDATGINFLPYDCAVGLLMIILCINAIRIAWSDLIHPFNPTFTEKISDFSQRYNLTPREIDILEALGDGLTNKEIGEVLFISSKTVENHLSKIYSKSQMNNRFQLMQELGR